MKIECINCVYWHYKGISDPLQYSYCEYWGETTKGSERCENFDVE